MHVRLEIQGLRVGVCRVLGSSLVALPGLRVSSLGLLTVGLLHGSIAFKAQAQSVGA